MLKNRCFETVVLEKSLESPLDYKEIKPVNPKGIQPWIFIGRTRAQSEAPTLWPSDDNSWPLEKTLMLGKIEGKSRRGQHRMRWLDGITDSMDTSLSKLGDSEGQGSLACCSLWGFKKSDTTKRLKELSWTMRSFFLFFKFILIVYSAQFWSLLL